MAVLPRDKSHLIVDRPSATHDYRSPVSGGGASPLPSRNREQHAKMLLKQTARAIAGGEAWISEREPTIAEGEPGFYLSFVIPETEMEAIAGRVGDGGRKANLAAVQRPAVREDGTPESEFGLATVFVPKKAADYFIKKVEQYKNEDRTNADGEVVGPKNEALVARIEDIILGHARSIFTDEMKHFPKHEETVWWEVWVKFGQTETVCRVAGKLGLNVRDAKLSFPEHDVILIYGNEENINRLLQNVSDVTELRIATDIPAAFSDMPPYEQSEWANDMAGRITAPPPEAPFVTILDSGANQGHPLISPALDLEDQFTVDSEWGVGDTSIQWSGHGTAMAGGVLYPNLGQSLTAQQQIPLEYRLETVKVLPDHGENEPRLYGQITEAAVSTVENNKPDRTRVFCMAISSPHQMKRGRPSSWSAAIDKLALGHSKNSRLIILAAGNIRDNIVAHKYPDRNDIEPVESPGQAWNALVVGGFTQLNTLIDPDYDGWEPVASVGELAPVSRTSMTWSKRWPIRPDVVFEAGNLAYDAASPATPADPASDLQLLTTHYHPERKLLESFGDTSAAAAQAASLCARLQASYPALWPESIRGLMIHSAEWTPQMRSAIEAAKTQRDKIQVMRRVGWGVPNPEHALRSAANDATVIIEDEITPFEKAGSGARFNELRLHTLPWPEEELQALGNEQIELRVTLSYFIEPNPAERGWIHRHRYSSHGLRFKLKQPTETSEQFHVRINKAVEAEDDIGQSPKDQDGWMLGQHLRDLGSVHSDFWRGSASELAERNILAVVPVSGWWKEKPKIGRCDEPVRYSLIVSIKTEAADVDIYTAIANEIVIPIPAS